VTVGNTLKAVDYGAGTAGIAPQTTLGAVGGASARRHLIASSPAPASRDSNIISSVTGQHFSWWYYWAITPDWLRARCVALSAQAPSAAQARSAVGGDQPPWTPGMLRTGFVLNRGAARHLISAHYAWAAADAQRSIVMTVNIDGKPTDGGTFVAYAFETRAAQPMLSSGRCSGNSGRAELHA
jgi:hypothetical protein